MNYPMPGDELGPCPCGHRRAMCHRVNASQWCGGDGDPYAGPLLYAIRLARRGLPDPMHPGIPRQFVDGLVAAKIVLAAALGEDDPGDVDAARASLEALSGGLVQS